jgi:glycine/D-amino acid oxidase-like deaminating enzyme
MPGAKDETVPVEVLSRVIQDALRDPGLPLQNPTESFWQLPAHESVAVCQSDTLPTSTDVAVIGSGVTGCSVVKNLLENANSPTSAHITVLEARSLTSGATGRNGGHLVSPLPGHFNHFEDTFGREQAVKIARFANRTLESMHRLGQQDEELVKAAEVRRVRSATGYRDADTLHAVALAVKRYEDTLPECRGDIEIVDAAEAEQVRRDSLAIRMCTYPSFSGII